MKPWSEQTYGFAQHGELFARALTLSYGCRRDGWQWLTEYTKDHDRALIHQTGPTRDLLILCYSLADFARYGDASAAQRLALLSNVEAYTRKLSKGAYGRFFAPLARAQLHAMRGDAARALSAAQEGWTLARQLGHESHSQNAAYLLGVLRGPERGAELREGALAFFQERGWKDPWRAATMFVPAVRALDGAYRAVASQATSLFLGRYQLTSPLPVAVRHAFSDALDARTGRTVTLCVLGHLDATTRALAKEELRAHGDVHHENLAQSEGLHEHEGRLIVVLERVSSVDFLAFVRPDGKCDIERLRSALAQVLAGLAALHEAGLVHGEPRASLLRVGPEGRVQILGRGLLGARAEGQEEEPEDLDYLAPERLEGGAPSAAADLYALGTCLYQALTGQLPFAQLTVRKLREAKQRGRAIPPSALRIEVPSEIEELCLSMLERDPQLRPTASEAAQRLSGSPEASAAARAARRAKVLASLVSASQEAAVQQRVFTGRARELEALVAALLPVAQGAHPLACVSGEGGIGKTALVSEALERLRARVPNVLVLQSRCYANEQLSLQAFDGAVAELTGVLKQLPEPELEALLPPRASLLAQLFPALASVPSIRSATKKGIPAEPGARRGAALATFVALLTRLSLRVPLVLMIDDLQWADEESFALLRALVSPAQPAPAIDPDTGFGIAVVATLRRGEARDAAVREGLSQLLAHPQAVSLEVERLSEADACSLARHIFGSKPSDAQIMLAARESGGHPLFLRELAQARLMSGSQMTLSLEQALLERVGALPTDARALLELLALLARPCPAHVLERAAGLGQRFDEALRALLRAGLIQRRGPLGLTCFHDRLREAVASRTQQERTAALFGQLAEALAAEEDSDPAELARLWDAAGELARAGAAYSSAGARAIEALSFAAAERLYARALELADQPSPASRMHLLAQRGHAFVALGRSREAAQLFEQAAGHASGADGIRLRVWAAQHQIQSAQFEDGMRNARAVLEELGTPLPAGNARALARIAWERGLVALRGTKVATHKEIDERDRLKLDATCSLSFPLSWADFLPGSALITMHMRRALVIGDPGHAARALAQEAGLRATIGDHAGSQALFPLASRLAEESCLPAPLASVQFAQGMAAFMRGEIAVALDRCLTAEDLLLTSCPEEAWLLTNVRMTISVALARGGDFLQFASLFKAWFADARGRQDTFAVSALFGLGWGYNVFLMEDHLAEAFATLDEAMRPWRARPPGFAKGGELFAQCGLGLYAGDDRAYEWLRGSRAEHERSFFLRYGEMRIARDSSHALAALAARTSASGERRAELLVEAHTLARNIPAKGSGAFVRPFTLAQVEALEGRTEAAMASVREALLACEAQGEVSQRHRSAYFLGLLEGGESGRARCAASLAFFRERGWRDAWRAATMYVPAARELEGKT